jgi:hypothetical protein
MITPYASSYSRWNSNRVLRPKPKTVQPVVLRLKPPILPKKRIRYASSTISTRVIVVLDRLITKSSGAST